MEKHYGEADMLSIKFRPPYNTIFHTRSSVSVLEVLMVTSCFNSSVGSPSAFAVWGSSSFTCYSKKVSLGSWQLKSPTLT